MDEQTKLNFLWDWTKAHLKNGVQFNLPSDQELQGLGIELKMSMSDQHKNKPLMQVYLADEKYCKECMESGYKKTCYLNGKKKTMLVVDGDISFGSIDCEKYARF